MAPDRALAQAKYRKLAERYDRRVSAVEGIRRRAAGLLELKRGQIVLDVGCGTGLSFPLLEGGVGEEGTIVGIDLSPEMLARARQRVEAAGWKNVTLIQSAIEDAQIPVEADAAFFHFTHDIMRTPAALDNVFRHVKPGGLVVSAGGKRAPWWALPTNLVMSLISRQYVTTFEGMSGPWSHLPQYVADLQVKSVLFGGGYIAWGRASGPQSD